MNIHDNTVHMLMEQAQVFASRWAIAGSQFDYGGGLETAETEKHVLGRMIENALAAVAPPPPAVAESHPDDIAVSRFSAAVKAKLHGARAKGRGGWETCPPEELSRMLREHVEKGDPRDVAAFCCFLWNLGSGITPGADATTPPVAALRLPEPMTGEEIYASDELMRLNGRKLGLSLNELVEVVGAIEAEVIRRVKEANE